MPELLKSLFKQVFAKSDVAPTPLLPKAPALPRVLNVGGGSREIGLTPHYDAWERHWLDIDAKAKPDVLCDARELTTQPAAAYEAVYCSHNLEHYHHHEVQRVLRGILHVIKDDGFAHFRVPNIEQLLRMWHERKLDIDSEVAISIRGPILIRDIIWGLSVEIEESGRDYYAHKTGFSPKTLTRALEDAGFAEVFLMVDGQGIEIAALAFKRAGPNPYKSMFEIGSLASETLQRKIDWSPDQIAS